MGPGCPRAQRGAESETRGLEGGRMCDPRPQGYTQDCLRGAKCLGEAGHSGDGTQGGAESETRCPKRGKEGDSTLNGCIQE